MTNAWQLSSAFPVEVRGHQELPPLSVAEGSVPVTKDDWKLLFLFLAGGGSVNICSVSVSL